MKKLIWLIPFFLISTFAAAQKISELPAATTPVAGTELAAIVQSGATRKIAISDLVPAAAITYAKFQNLTGLSIFGRASNSSGVGADITAATDGHVLRRSGTTIGFGTIGDGSVSFTAPPIGAATATTATLGTNSTHVATTAFVKTAIDNQPLVVPVTDQVTPITVTANKWCVPNVRTRTVTTVTAYLTSAQASGALFTVDILEAGVSILSTKITLDNNETTSATAVTAPVISDTSIAAGALVCYSITQTGSGSAAGLTVVIE